MVRIPSDVPTSYQRFLSVTRRYDRDATLIGLSTLLGNWNGNTHDASGRQVPFLPWSVAGLASTMLGRGYSGGIHPTPTDLYTLTYMHSDLAHPVDESDPLAGLRLISRFVYQQWPFTRHSGSDWARPTALFVDTPFPPEYTPEVMKDGWAEELLGTDVGTFVSVGFILRAAAGNGSRYPFEWEEGVLDVLELAGGQDRFNAIVRSNYVTTIEAFKTARRTAVMATGATPGARFLREPFAHNPLFSTPLIEGILPGFAIAPCLPAIAMKTSVLGIIYKGLERWGVAFTHDVGKLFEAYVGRQLNSRGGWSVLPEITYGPRSNLLSVDWFIISERYVVLIECKAALPTAAMREGSEAFLEAHVSKLEKSIKQLNKSRKLILDQIPEFASIPSNLPMVGLSVTLGNFDMANDPFIRSAMTFADFPVAVVGVDFLEWFVTLSDQELDATLAEAHSTEQHGVFEPRALMEDMVVAGNPILARAFDDIPVHSRLIASGHVSGSFEPQLRLS
jgi:hypothetical protein